MKNIVMVSVAVAAIVGCSQSQVEGEVSSVVASATESDYQVLRTPGPTVRAKCSDVLPAAVQYYATCSQPVAMASASMEHEVFCTDVRPENLAFYPTCVDDSIMATVIAPPQLQPPLEEPEDINAFADSAGNLGTGTDDTNSSESELSSIDGTRTATQTSGGITVRVSSGETHPSLLNID